jgi:hypothetical protein
MAKRSKRKMPPHIVLPNGQWRFVKRGRSQTKKRKVVQVARRRRSYGRRFVGRARRSAGGMGGWKSMIAPIAGGAGDVIAQKYIPIFGIGSTAAGMFLKDQVTMKIGLNKIGESLGAMFAGGGGNGGSGGWL